MNKRVFSLGALALACAPAWADYKLNFQEPASALAGEVYDLHTFLLVICAVIFVVVFGMMFYSIFKHRKSTGHKAAQFHESTLVEVIWTIIPCLILMAMAYPATKVIIAQKDSRGADMTIKVTGYQWKWGYEYLEDGVNFHSRLATPQEQYENFAGEKPQRNANYLLEVDNQVVVPVGKRVRLLLTANDVIHSWWVPAFGVKQDAIPGFIRDAWFKADKEGIYRGQCVELCGKDHGFMPIVVSVVSQEKYDAWVLEQKKLAAANLDDPNKVWQQAELVARGSKVYEANCAVCHKPDGKGLGAFPALDGSKVVNGAQAGQVALVMNGKGAMPAWSKTLSDTELAAVITYTRNSWGNKTGDILQPSDIKAARQ